MTLGLKSSVKIDDELVHVDPQLLFQRLTIASKSSDNFESVFKYELCSHPPTLFDSSQLLRESNKAILANAIWESLETGMSELSGEVQFVLDGGALLHRIPWPQSPVTYIALCSLYTQYVIKKYGNAIVVFDGYSHMSTKDTTHQRRTSGKVGATISFDMDMLAILKKPEFLSNHENKQNFINLLSDALVKSNCRTCHSDDDADVFIVQTAVESAKNMDTVLVGDDTDLLVLLCYYTDLKSHNLYFRPEPKRNQQQRIWNMKVVREQLGQEICTNMLFIHGCDTTSQLYGIGKKKAFQKFKSNRSFREQAQIFDSEFVTKQDIEVAGEKALVCLYNGKFDDSLDVLRHKRFCEKVATKSVYVQPQSLPPTTAAAKYHSYRVYFQIMKWKLSDIGMQPEEWGWKISNGKLHPVMTDLSPAPENILRIIRCNCFADCSTTRCTCRKHNLVCSSACGQCRGSGCTNSTRPTFVTEEEDELYESLTFIKKFMWF